MRRALTLGLAAAAAATVGLAGCGAASTGSATTKDDSATSKTAAVREAFTKTAHAKSARVRIDQLTAVHDRSARVSGHGSIDFTHDALTMTLATGNGGKLLLRKTGGVAYVRPPASVREGLPDGASWIAIDLAKLGKKRFGEAYARMRGGLATHPMHALRYLRAASDVTEVGEATINGATTTHYKVRVDLRKVADNVGTDGESALRQVRQRLATNKLPLQLWLDDQGRVRQERMNLRFETPAGHDASVRTTIKLLDFGAPVAVKPPPKARTAAVDELLRSGQ